ncbi:hypothetical protein LXL04_012859 [Taraxacum kok-saghyz]
MASPCQPFTVIEPWVFEAITPSQYITFTMANPLNHRRILHALVLRVAVLDSPTAKADDEYPNIAAIVVPRNLETDWNFCSESGHNRLLFKLPNISRLILIGNNPPPNPGLVIYKRPPVIDNVEHEMLRNELKPLLMSMHPKVSFYDGLPETEFFTSDDDVAYRITVAKYTGPVVGEFLVEDIELVDDTDRNKELRRRMRFKRTPNLVQSEALLVPTIGYDEGTTQTDLESLSSIETAKFEANTTVLVHYYVIHMVTGLFLIASHLNLHSTPRALCLGVGGGVLLNFLDDKMGFEVTGVEADQVIITAATEHFGLNKSGSIRLIVGDAIKCIQNFPPRKPSDESDSEVNKDVVDPKFDVVFVDLDSSEGKIRFCAPPREFVTKPVFEGLKSLLNGDGVLIMNVVPLNEKFFTTLVKDLKEIFHKVYGINVGVENNYVVMATVSSTSKVDNDNEFLKKLKSELLLRAERLAARTVEILYINIQIKRILTSSFFKINLHQLRFPQLTSNHLIKTSMMATPIRPFPEIEPEKFEAITPSQFITFTTQNTLSHRRLLHFPLLRVAVLDSPTAKADDESPVIAAMVVPRNLETDWNFCTESGHNHLLFKFPNISRLILIGNNPPPYTRLADYKHPPPTDSMERQILQKELKPLLMSMHPKVSFNQGLPETLFFTSEDDVAYRVTVAKIAGPIVGEFIVEDIELVGNKELRRRMRFKRTPNLIQSEALLVPFISYDEATTQTGLESLRKTETAYFEADTTVLGLQYLIAMVSGLFLTSSHLNLLFTPKALCLGIGGGVLLNFLDTQMGFEVTGVEIDPMVVSAAIVHFGLNKSGSIRLIVGDAIKSIQNFPPRKPTDESKVNKDVVDAKFDVVFVDLDSNEDKNTFCAPPTEFVKKPVFEGLRSLLNDHGVLIMNVVPLNKLFYKNLVKELKEIFHKVYEIDIGDEVNFVVMATVSPTSSDNNDNEFMKKLKSILKS